MSSSSASSGGGAASTGPYLGIGGVAYNMARFGANPTGSKTLLGKVYPELHFALRLGVGPIVFAPTVGYTPLGKEGADSAKSKLLILTAPVSFSPIFDSLDFKLGPGVIWYTVDGPQSVPTTKTLPNGTTTAEFVLPDRSATTRSFVLAAGVGYALGDFRADLDVLASNAFNGPRRTVSMMFNLSYRLYD